MKASQAIFDTSDVNVTLPGGVFTLRGRAVHNLY